MILFARSLSGKNPDFWPRKSPIDVSGILRRVRLAVPKISVSAMLHRMGFPTRRYPFIASLVLCYQEQEATIGQLKEDFRIAAARLFARLDEQDSKNPESERPSLK